LTPADFHLAMAALTARPAAEPAKIVGKRGRATRNARLPCSPEDRAAAFRTVVQGLGFTQASFSRFLDNHGRPTRYNASVVQRWAKSGPPPDVVVILAMLARGK